MADQKVIIEDSLRVRQHLGWIFSPSSGEFGALLTILLQKNNLIENPASGPDVLLKKCLAVKLSPGATTKLQDDIEAKTDSAQSNNKKFIYAIMSELLLPLIVHLDNIVFTRQLAKCFLLAEEFENAKTCLLRVLTLINTTRNLKINSDQDSFLQREEDIVYSMLGYINLRSREFDRALRYYQSISKASSEEARLTKSLLNTSRVGALLKTKLHILDEKKDNEKRMLIEKYLKLCDCSTPQVYNNTEADQKGLSAIFSNNALALEEIAGFFKELNSDPPTACRPRKS